MAAELVAAEVPRVVAASAVAAGASVAGASAPEQREPADQRAHPPARAGSISLPFTDLARSEWVVTTVALGQTLIFAGLLAGWLLLRPPVARHPAVTRLKGSLAGS